MCDSGSSFIGGINIQGVLDLLKIGPEKQYVSDAQIIMIHINSRKVIRYDYYFKTCLDPSSVAFSHHVGHRDTNR